MNKGTAKTARWMKCSYKNGTNLSSAFAVNRASEIIPTGLRFRPNISKAWTKTTESAASLTRQLLSFARKHVFSPQVIDLNALVGEMSKMLPGLLGEEMELVVKLDPWLGSISADPGQIEQVIMNLVVNARDAMPQGGRLGIETANMNVQDGSARHHAVVPAGKYVRLTVSDSGIGMDSET